MFQFSCRFAFISLLFYHLFVFQTGYSNWIIINAVSPISALNAYVEAQNRDVNTKAEIIAVYYGISVDWIVA